MTDKEITNLKRSLPLYYRDMTNEQIILSKELAWRNYCNSCIIYGEQYHIVREGRLVLNGSTRLTYFYYQGNEIITPKRALEIFYEQVQSIKEKTVISRGVYTDSDGCTYNSIKWIDD